MKEIIFRLKPYGEAFGVTHASRQPFIPKPMICPLCNAFSDGILRERKLFTRSANEQFGVILFECPHCNKRYLASFEIDLREKEAKFGGFLPESQVEYENETLKDLSPRFIDAYNQALRAENIGDTEIAAIGFRYALECLVKDYAINERHISREIVVKKSLAVCIGDYLDNSSLLASADVVRILGNDYAHYERKYPQHDFELLKKYMSLFINFIETQLLIAHPPVSRSGQPQQASGLPKSSTQL